MKCHMKATEQYFAVVLFIMVNKLGLTPDDFTRHWGDRGKYCNDTHEKNTFLKTTDLLTVICSYQHLALHPLQRPECPILEASNQDI